MTRIRSWLHWHGVHAFCQVRRVWRPAPLHEFIRTLDGETLDITNQSGGSYRVSHY